jgi:ABC-type glycerol-3-phosphate transport system substrate-binding protein
MIRFFHFLLLGLLSVLIISGCGEKEKAGLAKKEITFWHFWSEPYQKRAIDSIIKQFETESGIIVETTELSWNDGKTKLMAAFNSGTAPDVLELGSDWVAQFSSSGVLAGIAPDSADIGKYLEFSRKPCYWKNGIYALPWIVDTRVLFYNKHLMRKAGLDTLPPATMDRMLEMSQKINDIKGKYGFGVNGSDPHRLYKKIVPLMWTFGGRILNDQGVPVIDSPENIAALDYYTRLARAGVVETQRQIDAMFARGEIGLWISGGWLLEKIANENPAMNFGVAQLPGVDGGKGISFAGGEYLSINNSTKNFSESMEFIKYMTNGSNAIKFCKIITEAGFPADAEYYNAPYYQSKPRRLVFARQLGNARMTPVHPKWLDIEAAVEEATVRALYGRNTPSESLGEAQEKASRIMKMK